MMRMCESSLITEMRMLHCCWICCCWSSWVLEHQRSPGARDVGEYDWDLLCPGDEFSSMIWSTPHTLDSVIVWSWGLLHKSDHPSRMECLHTPCRRAVFLETRLWEDCSDSDYTGSTLAEHTLEFLEDYQEISRLFLEICLSIRCKLRIASLLFSRNYLFT